MSNLRPCNFSSLMVDTVVPMTLAINILRS